MAISKISANQLRGGTLASDIDILLQDSTSYLQFAYSDGSSGIFLEDNTVPNVTLSSKDGGEVLNIINTGIRFSTAGVLTAEFNSGTLRLYDDDASNYVALQTPATLSGNYTLTLPADDGTADQVLKTDGAGVLSWTTITSGVSDHGGLTGLSDDDHTQYALLAGRGTSQTLYGGTTAGGGLVLYSTTNATKGSILLNPEGGDVHIGGGATRSYLYLYEDTGSGGNKVGIRAATGMSADYNLTLPVDDGTTGQYLKTDGSGNLSWDTPAGGGSSSGIAGAVQYSNGSGGFSSEESNLFYNSANNQLSVANGVGYTMLVTGDNGGISIGPITDGLTGALNAINVTGSVTGNMNINVTNSNTGTSANSRLLLTTASTGGDPFVGLSVGDATYVIGVDNSDSNRLKIGLGTNPSSMTSNPITIEGNRVGLGGQTAPTAAVHLPAGTATSNTAPLKFTSGTALTTPEDGSIEYHGSHLYFTIGSTRYQLDQQVTGTPGDVVGPASAVNNRIVTFDGTSGKLIKDSGYSLPTGTIVGTSDSQTLTNKRIDPRTNSQTGSGGVTISPDPSSVDVYYVTALSGTLTLGTFAGSPVIGNKITIAVKDNSTSRTISWNANYKAMGVTLPTTTISGKWLYINVIYYDASNYHVVGISSEA